MTFDSTELRQAFGRFATGVAIVTAYSRCGERLGITVNSLSSVSLDPPLILFCAAKSLNCIDKLLGAPRFAINILAEDQHEISSRFARPLCDKWAEVDSHESERGLPVLDGTLAVFECVPFSLHDAGDHFIVVGRIEHFSRRGARNPLLYFGGAYRQVQEEISV